MTRYDADAARALSQAKRIRNEISNRIDSITLLAYDKEGEAASVVIDRVLELSGHAGAIGLLGVQLVELARELDYCVARPRIADLVIPPAGGPADTRERPADREEASHA